MKSKVGLSVIVLGVLLVFAAAGLVLYNVSEDKKSGDAAQSVLETLKEQIVPVEDETEFFEGADLFSEYETEEELPPIEIDGEFYIGYISMPSIGIELPVMDSWSYDKLKTAPCRYSGSVLENDIVIAAHNYSSHFGGIESLSSGDEINLIATDGRIFRYEVVNTEIVSGKDISAMEPDDSWDLTLFTCTLSGQSRVTVRAVRAE